MLRGAVARRYAQALFGIARDEDIIDELQQQLQTVAEIITENDMLRRFINHPQVTADQKKELLLEILGGKISKVAEGFLMLLVERHREAYLGGIVEEYARIADKARNVTEARVSSAVKLTDEQRNKLVQILRGYTGMEVRTSYDVDPGLLGGVLIRIGDQVIDGSIRTRLNTLGERLRQIEVREIGVNQ